MKVSAKFFLSFFLFVMIMACKHEPILDEGNKTVAAIKDTSRLICDTSSVTYSKDVSSILSTHCYSCHSGKAADAGLRLEEYNVVKSLALGGDNDLVNDVNGNPDHVYMPPAPAAKLSKCEINKLQKWVNDGALNN